MPTYRDDLEALSPFPATFVAALMELASSIAPGLALRLKSGQPTVIEAPAGSGNDQVGLVIEGKWRWITRSIEVAGNGLARTVEVWATTGENSFGTTLVGGQSVETDDTDYSFALAIVEVGGAPGVGTYGRKVATAVWDGARFLEVLPVVGVTHEQVMNLAWAPADVRFTSSPRPAPTGWIRGEGQLLRIADYPGLYAEYGTLHGGDGRTTFGVPDLRDRHVAGAGLTRALGERFGSATHTHAANIPNHTHGITVEGNHAHGIGSDGNHAHSISGEPNTNAGAFQGGVINVDRPPNNHAHGGATGAAGTHSHGGATGGAGSHSHGGATGGPSTTALVTGATANDPLTIALYGLIKT